MGVGQGGGKGAKGEKERERKREKEKKREIREGNRKWWEMERFEWVSEENMNKK